MTPPVWHRLVRGEDAGGQRWFLGGRPVHAGTGLILRLPCDPERARFAAQLERVATHRAEPLGSADLAMIQRAAARIRCPVARVVFETRDGVPCPRLASGTDPYTYDDDNQVPGDPEDRWTDWRGPALGLVAEGAWSRYDLAWPDELPWIGGRHG